MPNIQYPKNSNSDTAFVVQEGGQKNRVLMTVEDNDGTVEYSDSPNSTNAYVTIDGKKHRAVLTAPQDTSTLEMSDNPNSTKGYVTVDGKKHRVVLTANIAGGGSTPVIDELNVTPSTSAQTITAPEGTDGYSPVNVAAVTSSIDANIVAGNIKKDVQILGVTGSYEGITPTGTLPITINGIYDVSSYANADVQVSGAPAYYIEKIKKDSQPLSGGTYTDVLCSGFNDLDLTDIKNIIDYGLAYAFYQKDPTNTKTGTALKNATSLINIAGDHALYYTFYNNTGITSTGLNYLQTLIGPSCMSSCFEKCSSLGSIGLDNLEEISSSATYALSRCFAETGITTADFIKLSKINIWSAFGQNTFNSCFAGCTKLQNIYFRAVKASTFSSLTTQLQFLCGSTTGSAATEGCTIHFPSNFDPTNPDKTFDITTLAGYPNFGGNSSYIHLAYDLPATE